MIAIPLTILILLFVSAGWSPRSSRSRSRSRPFSPRWACRLPQPVHARRREITRSSCLVGLAVGVDYSLFYMRREREERAAGRSEGAALEAAAATSGRAVLSRASRS